MAVINAGYVNNKSDYLKLYIKEKHIDICCISETWLKSSDPGNQYECKNIIPNGYIMHSTNRTGKQGGGVAVVCKSGYKSEHLTGTSYNSFEYVIVQLRANENSLQLINVYRPPDLSVASFYDDFSDLLERTNSLTSELLITGDFNIHLNMNSSTAIKFKERLDIFNLKQHVAIPTHMDGHTLNFIISRNNDQLDMTNPIAL